MSTDSTRRLEGKVAIITGGASGIGESTAKLFVQHGAKVAILDVQDELGHSVVKALAPSSAIYIRCDVTNEDNVRDAVDKTVSTFGKLDIMFNNAGTSDEYKPLANNEKTIFERVMSVNVTGVFFGMKHASRVMVPTRKGTIISTASVASVLGGASAHAYCASKHAVVGLTKSLAVELGQFGIRVNCLSPFGIVTPLAKRFVGAVSDEELQDTFVSMGILKGTVLKTADMANAALFLASDEAKYINGHNLVVDGGFSVTNSAVHPYLKTPDH